MPQTGSPAQTVNQRYFESWLGNNSKKHILLHWDLFTLDTKNSRKRADCTLTVKATYVATNGTEHIGIAIPDRGQAKEPIVYADVLYLFKYRKQTNWETWQYIWRPGQTERKHNAR